MRSCVLALAVLALLLPGEVRADVVFPAAWGGVWSLESINLECVSGDTLSASARIDSICPGDLIETIIEYADLVDVTCTGAADPNRIDAFCEGTYSALPGCADVEWDFVATRSGATMGIVQQIRVDFIGACSWIADTCIDGTVTATRLSTDTSFCAATPIEPDTWGRVKAAYR